MREKLQCRESVIRAISILAFSLAFTAVDPAQARRHHRPGHARHAAAPYSPPYSAMVIDANSGRVLHAVDENELRHPASITKVMTLYMLFEQLDRGKMSLADQLTVSAHAASMEPSKLGLTPGATISVENAIKAICTKSANDMAVVVAEAIGGSEDHFAEMMTAKAHSLGMSRTNYANASGLPDDDQVTTAHDLIILGRSILERFPRYYSYFSTHQFNFAGRTIRNHNHLLGRIEGLDGIKTGYTRASGFNLLSSVKRGERRIVSVVLGGRSAGVRDKIMSDLIEQNIGKGSTTHTARNVEEPASVEHAEAPKAEVRKPEPVHAEAEEAPAPVKADPPRPWPLTGVAEKPHPAVVANPTKSIADERTASIPEAKRQTFEGSTRAVAASPSTTGAVTGGMRWVAGPPGASAKPVRGDERVAKAEPVKEAPAAKAEPVHTGIMIQIGASDDAGKANELLARAKSSHAPLAGATSFTEKVRKGSETLWRARFAGLTETQADTACKSLKRSGFSCFTTRN